MLTPQTSGPAPAGTTVPYFVSVTNNDIGKCQPTNYNMFIAAVVPGRRDGGVPGTTTVTTSGVTTGVGTGGPIPIPMDGGGSEASEAAACVDATSVHHHVRRRR